MNFGSSIRLAPHLGALGVAIGTLLGAVIGVAMHFGVSMRYTQASLEISPPLSLGIFVQRQYRPFNLAPVALVARQDTLHRSAAILCMDRFYAAFCLVCEHEPRGSGSCCTAGWQQYESTSQTGSLI